MLVHRLGYRRGVDIDVACITYQRFTQKRNSYRPPLTCRTTARGLELEREAEILKAQRIGCLFVRKVAASCDLRCLASSAFERFQCATAAKPPTKEEPCVPIRNQATTFAGGCRR